MPIPEDRQLITNLLKEGKGKTQWGKSIQTRNVKRMIMRSRISRYSIYPMITNRKPRKARNSPWGGIIGIASQVAYQTANPWDPIIPIIRPYARRRRKYETLSVSCYGIYGSDSILYWVNSPKDN